MPGCIPPIARVAKEILEQLVPVFRENGLRVKLHPGQRVSPVTQSHHRPIIGPGSDFELGRKISGLNHEGVIAGGRKRTG